MKKQGNKSIKDFIPAVAIGEISEETLKQARRIVNGGMVPGIETRQVEVDVEKIDKKLWTRRQELVRKLKEKYMEQFDDEDSRELKALSERLALTLNSAASERKDKEGESVR